MPAEIRRLQATDVELMQGLLNMFGEAFGERSTYSDHQPGREYLQNLLGGDSFIALVGLKGGVVVGGLAAYELRKFEQERSEIYIYDLAVLADHRREGIATALIETLKQIAACRGAYTIIVQADTGAEDKPAIELYGKLGTREEILHFDIPVPGRDGASG